MDSHTDWTRYLWLSTYQWQTKVFRSIVVLETTLLHTAVIKWIKYLYKYVRLNCSEHVKHYQYLKYARYHNIAQCSGWMLSLPRYLLYYKVVHSSHLLNEAEWPICAPVRWAIIVSDNGLSPFRRQAIIWNNAEMLLIGTLGTNFSEILSEIHTFSFKKMHLKMSSAKWRQLCLDLNMC